MGNRQPKLVRHHGNVTFVGWPCWGKTRQKEKVLQKGSVTKRKNEEDKDEGERSSVMLKKFFIASTGNFQPSHIPSESLLLNIIKHW